MLKISTTTLGALQVSFLYTQKISRSDFQKNKFEKSEYFEHESSKLNCQKLTDISWFQATSST